MAEQQWTQGGTQGKTLGKMIKIKLVRSPIGYNVDQKRTVRALGLTRLHQVVERPDNPAIRGMVNAIQHLVEVTE